MKKNPEDILVIGKNRILARRNAGYKKRSLGRYTLNTCFDLRKKSTWRVTDKIGIRMRMLKGLTLPATIEQVSAANKLH